MRARRRIPTLLAGVALTIGTVLVPLGGAADAAPAAPSSPATEVSDGVRHSIARLYLATFDRPAEAAGLAYWTDLYVRGLPLTTIAEHLVASDEWRATYGAVDDAGFVSLLYRNVLDRDPDRSGLAYWTGLLGQGHPRVGLLLGFSEGAEFVAATGTSPPEAPTVAAFPAVPANSGSGRRIVYDNDRQRVWLVDQHGLIDDSYLVSGRAMTPGPGTYRVFSMSVRAWAGHDGITMRHMVRFARGRSLAIGFHSIPRFADGRPLQSEAQLGTYRSAGCVRQADHKAEALYAWAGVGTTVVVLP